MNRTLGTVLIVLTSLQSTPFFVSNFFFFSVICTLIFVKVRFFSQNKRKLGTDKYSMIFSMVWLSYSIISVIWSIDKFLWFRSSIVVLLIAMSIDIFYHLIIDEEDVIFYLKVIIGIFIFNNLIGWFEVFSGKYLITISEYKSVYAYNSWPVASFINTNDYSTYISILIPLVISSFYYNKKLSSKILVGMSIVSAILLLNQATSRANIIAVFVGISFIMIATKLKKTLGTITYIIFLFSIFICVVLLVLNSFIGERIVQKLVHDDVKSDQLRINLIKNGLIHLRNSNYLGVGAGNLEYLLPKHQYFRTYNFKDVHNWWIEVLVNYGILIFIGYLIFWGKILYVSIFKKSINKNISLALGASIIVFFISVISPSSILLMKWLPIYTGIIVASINILNKKVECE